jgi:chemotaxis response regulator CheB
MLNPVLRVARDIVVLGGSAGGIQAVIAIVRALPGDFAGSIFIALHRGPDPAGAGTLADVFAGHTAVRTQTPRDNQRIQPSTIYVAPPDRQMSLENGVVRVLRSPHEERFRPCVNVLFKTAAATYGRRVVGVLVTGSFGSDGVAGLWQIRHRGGVTIVQDPADAPFPGMPQSAIDSVAVDYVLPVAQIGPALSDLVCAPSAGVAAAPPRILIVEDESVVATNLQYSLREMGYDAIDWVPTGEAAIEIAERDAPDLILMDIRLAGPLTGVETARRIWERLQIPVVYCTAHADVETLKAVQTTESYGYVVKPYHSTAVRAAVELALARHEKGLR